MSVIVDTTAAGRLDCEQTVRRLWDYLDGEIGTSELAAIDAHLQMCNPCSGHYVFERRFLEALRAARDAISARDAVSLQQLRARVVESLVAAGEMRAPGTDPGVDPGVDPGTDAGTDAGTDPGVDR